MNVRVQDLVGGTAQSNVPRPPFRWKTRIALPVVLLAGVAALLLGSAWRTLFPGRTVGVIPVMVRTVSASTSTATVTASGWLEPAPFPTFITALAQGTVEEVLVLEGATVTKGQVVARLDAELALRRAESEVEISRSDVARAEADVDALDQKLETLIDRKRDLSDATGRIAEIEATLGQLDEQIEAEAGSLESLRDELERKRNLVQNGSVSEGEYRRLSLSVDVQARKLEAKRKERPILEARLERTKADLRAAEEHLELQIEERQDLAVARAQKTRAEAVLARAEAVRAEAQLRLDRMSVIAPADGIVMTRLVSPGSQLMAAGPAEHSSHVLHLYDPKSMQVRVDVPLADAAAVGVDQEARVEVQALSDRTFEGRVTRLVHEADIQKNTVEVKVELVDPDALLKPEMLARVRFLADTSKQESRHLLLAPESLLGDGSAVWVVESREGERGTARRRAVTLGDARVDGWREVVDGLRPGDWLIARPPADLHDGEPITVGEEESGS